MRRILIFVSAILLSSSLNAEELAAEPLRHDVRVAASDSPAKDKQEADFVCKGNDDQETIQAAIDAVGTGGTVFLASGNYFIEAFHEAKSGPDYALKTRRLDTSTKLRIKGTVRANGSGNGISGTNIVVTEECYKALSDDKEYSVIRGDDNVSSYWDMMAQELTVCDLTISLPDNQKNIICIDGYALGALNVDDLRLGTRIFNRSMDPEQEFRIGVDGCIGIRGLQGSNNGSETIFRSTYAIGLGVGFALSGEHLVCIQLGAIGNKYGYTFNNFTPEGGVWAHPITLINCCDEVSANYPYFGPNPYGQNVDLINFNMEHYTTMASKGGDYAREAVPGQWGGNIDYDIQDWETDSWNDPFPGNSPYRKFWAADGSGAKFTSKNNVHANSYSTAERNRIAPNIGQTIFDETLGKPLFCRSCGDYASAVFTFRGVPKAGGEVSLRVGNTKRTIMIEDGFKDESSFLEYIYRRLMVGTSCRFDSEKKAITIFNNHIGKIGTEEISCKCSIPGVKVSSEIIDLGKDNIWIDFEGNTL